MLARETFDSPHLWHSRSTLLQDAQKGRTSHPPTPARQVAPFPGETAASEEARRTLRYVEPQRTARTMLADYFSILLGLFLAC